MCHLRRSDNLTRIAARLCAPSRSVIVAHPHSGRLSVSDFPASTG